MHLVSSEKMEISRKCLEHSALFPVDLFLKQLASHISADTPFLEGFKVFCVVLMKEKSLHIKKNRKVWW